MLVPKRWLKTWGSHYAPWNTTLLGDDLYCHQPLLRLRSAQVCEAAIEAGFNVLMVCKPDSHATLYEWVKDFEREGKVQIIERTHWDGKQHVTERYRYINQVPLRNSDDALMLSWCELTVTNAKGKVTYKTCPELSRRDAWATTHLITDDNVAKIAKAGRSRWKIENENNNVLKNHGYNLKHNPSTSPSTSSGYHSGYHSGHRFGHGKQHLSNLLTTLTLLGFLLHTVLDWMDETYHTVRQLLPSRRTFFEHLRALMQYMLFDSWEHLIRFMLDGLADDVPD